MKNKFSSVIVSTIFAFTLPLTGTLMAYAAKVQEPGTSPNQGQPKQSQPSTDMVAEIFGGRILKSNGRYMLKDSSGKIAYMLDDQVKAKHYQGKIVVVTGTMDQDSNTIHVEKIEAAA
jgi:uncharacterized protein YdeI (BOF family)